MTKHDSLNQAMAGCHKSNFGGVLQFCLVFSSPTLAAGWSHGKSRASIATSRYTYPLRSRHCHGIGETAGKEKYRYFSAYCFLTD